VDAAQALEEEVVGELVVGRSRMPIPRLGPMLPTAEVTGHLEAMALYAGQSVGSVHAVEPAAQIVEELAGGAEALLKRGT
jgi:hypothetical protein